MIIIKSRDNYELKLKFQDLENLDSFFLTNLIIDTYSHDDIDDQIYEIDEDYYMIKHIFDSVRYKTLIHHPSTNLKLMLSICDKWCVPDWLISDIHKKLVTNEKLNTINEFLNNLDNNEVKQCKLCHTGFKPNENKKDSCKTHLLGFYEITNKFRCCGKGIDEPCLVGYHVEKCKLHCYPAILQNLPDNIFKP